MLVVGHSGAGPALPAIAAAIIGTAGLIFVDATLPRPGFSRSAGVPPAERDSAEFEAALARGTLRNLWAREATWNLAGISGADAAPLARETPDIPVAMNGEVVPTPANWDAFPAGYLAFVANAFYAPELAGARSRHWPTLEVPGAHFHMLVDPAAVAAALVRLADGLRAMNLSPGSRQAP